MRITPVNNNTNYKNKSSFGMSVKTTEAGKAELQWIHDERWSLFKFDQKRFLKRLAKYTKRAEHSPTDIIIDADPKQEWTLFVQVGDKIFSEAHEAIYGNLQSLKKAVDSLAIQDLPAKK